MREIIHYNHAIQDRLFDGGTPAKPNKHELVRELEKVLEASDYYFTKSSSIQTAVIMDFMSEMRKIPQERVKLNVKEINYLFERAYTSVSSVKEIDQVRKNTPLPLQMDRFWACPKNKQNLQFG